MGLFVSIILLLLGIYSHRAHKWWSPDTLFCYMWAVITFFSSLHLYTMYESSDKVYLIVLWGVLFYFLGTRISMRAAIKAKNVASYRDFISPKLFWFLLFFLFAALIGSFMQSYYLLMSGEELGAIRDATYGNDDSVGIKVDTGVTGIILDLVIHLLSPLVCAAGILYFTRFGVKKIHYFIMVLLFVVMQSFTDGGRFGLVFLIIELIIGFNLVNSFVKNERKTSPKFILIFVAILLFFVFLISFMRGITETDIFFTKYYRYLCGDIAFFDSHLPAIDTSNHWSLLGSSFWGFWSIVLPFLRGFFGMEYPDWYLYTEKYIMDTQEFRQIGTNMWTNAFSTPFYYPYADAGWIGVAVALLLLGLITGKIYIKAIKEQSAKYIIMYLIICQILFNTIFQYPFVNKGYVTIFLLLLLSRSKLRVFNK